MYNAYHNKRVYSADRQDRIKSKRRNKGKRWEVSWQISCGSASSPRPCGQCSLLPPSEVSTIRGENEGEEGGGFPWIMLQITPRTAIRTPSPVLSPLGHAVCYTILCCRSSGTERWQMERLHTRQSALTVSVVLVLIFLLQTE